MRTLTIVAAGLVVGGVALGFAFMEGTLPFGKHEDVAGDRRAGQLDCSVAVYEAVRFVAVWTTTVGDDTAPAGARTYADYVAALDSCAASSWPAGARAALARARGALKTIAPHLEKGERVAVLSGLAAAKAAVLDLAESLTPRPLNVLNHIVVDDAKGTVRFAGVHDPKGPSSEIPYEDIMAAAFAAPDEVSFSLEPGPGFDQDVAATAALFNDESEIARRTAAFYKDPAARERYGRSARTQAVENLCGTLKLALADRPGFDKFAMHLDLVQTEAEFTDTLVKLFREKILTPADERLVTEMIGVVLDNYQLAPGTIFFFPEGTAEGILQKDIRLVPRFGLGLDPRTELARTLFEADVALKTLTVSPLLKQRLPFHRTYLEWRFTNVPELEIRDARETPVKRIEVRPQAVELSTSADGRVLSLGKASLAIRVATVGESPSAIDAAYQDFLTGNLDAYAGEIDALWRLREAAKVLAAVRHLRAKGFVWRTPAGQRFAPPDAVPALWDLTSVGLGDAVHYGAVFFGGASLDGQAQVSALAESEVDAVRTYAGGSAGLPMAAGARELAALDAADASAALRDLPREGLRSLADGLQRENAGFDTKIAALKASELPLQMKLAAPPDFVTWQDAVRDMALKLPGASLAADLGQSAAIDLEAPEGAPTKPVETMLTAEKRFQSLTDDTMDTREVLKLVAGAGGTNLLELNLVAARESALLVRDVSRASSWKEAALMTTTRAGKVLEQLPDRLPDAVVAKLDPRIAQQLPRVNVYALAAKSAVELAYQAANIAVVNGAVAEERKAAEILLVDLASARGALERRRSENEALARLVGQEMGGRGAGP